jgi:hypothetical protein
MRFMMIVKASKDSEAGMMPDDSHIAAMTKYNEEMAKAGILLDLAGLQPSSKGTRIKFSGGRPTVVDGDQRRTKACFCSEITAKPIIAKLEILEPLPP